VPGEIGAARPFAIAEWRRARKGRRFGGALLFRRNVLRAGDMPRQEDTKRRAFLFN
jgi:hypothetical protein